MGLTMIEFCDVCHLIKQKYPHIKGIKDIASATLIIQITEYSITQYE